MEPDTRGISCCFDRESQHMLEDFRQNGLSDTATTILSALKAHGIAGTTSLELGCGVGGLTLRLLREGVTSARGIDLSPKVVDAARSLAAEEGFSGSVTFEVGDGATTPLGKADLVMLDAVICCYPDFPALIGNERRRPSLLRSLFRTTAESQPDSSAWSSRFKLSSTGGSRPASSSIRRNGS